MSNIIEKYVEKKDDIAQNLQDDAVEARDSCPVSAIDIEE